MASLFHRLKKKNKPALIAVFFILLALIGSVGVMSIYYRGSENTFTKLLTDVLPLPLARIENSTVLLRQYYDEIQSVSSQPDSSTLSASQVRQLVWKKLRDEYALRSLAMKYQLTWNKKEVDEYFQNYIDSASSAADYARDLQNQYHTSLGSFKEHIIVPLLLRDKITEYLMRSTDNASLQLIRSVYEKTTQDPSQFEIELKNYEATTHVSESTSTVLLLPEDLTGDLEYIKSMQINDVTPIIAASDGYRLYKLTNHYTEPQEAWQVQEFFVPARVFEDTFDEFQKNVKVIVYANAILNKKK